LSNIKQSMSFTPKDPPGKPRLIQGVFFPYTTGSTGAGYSAYGSFQDELGDFISNDVASGQHWFDFESNRYVIDTVYAVSGGDVGIFVSDPDGFGPPQSGNGVILQTTANGGYDVTTRVSSGITEALQINILNAGIRQVAKSIQYLPTGPIDLQSAYGASNPPTINATGDALRIMGTGASGIFAAQISPSGQIFGIYPDRIVMSSGTGTAQDNLSFVHSGFNNPVSIAAGATGTVWTFTTATDKAYAVDVRVIGRGTGTIAKQVFSVNGVFNGYNDSGTVARNKVTAVTNPDGLLQLNVTVAGTSFRADVTNGAADTVQFRASSIIQTMNLV